MDTMTQLSMEQPIDHDYSALMSLALDGMLDANEAGQLEQHLHACPACQASWTRWQRIAHVLTVEPFAGPPQGFALRLDQTLQRHEQRHERVLAGLVLAGGTATVLALLLLSTAVTSALWMAVSPDSRLLLVETLGFAGQFVTLVFQNLTSLRNAVLALLPSPVLLLIMALAMMAASAAWAGLVFYGARAGAPERN